MATRSSGGRYNRGGRPWGRHRLKSTPGQELLKQGRHTDYTGASCGLGGLRLMLADHQHTPGLIMDKQRDRHNRLSIGQESLLSIEGGQRQ